VKEVEWADAALQDMSALEKGLANRMRRAVERFASTGVGDVRKLHGMEPPEYRLRVGDYRIRFGLNDKTILVLRVRHRREAYR
jgi:mRNA interferase RelE/StbE